VASKEDILEQLVEEFLIHRGYFVRHNVKFLPRKDHPDFKVSEDSNHSDIDVLGFNPLLKGPDRVWAVGCKSWQSGFDPATKIREIEENRRVSGREAWKFFRELTRPKWSDGFMLKIQNVTGESSFTYVTAVTALIKSDRSVWENYRPFCSALRGNPIKIITLREMLQEVFAELKTTLAGTELGRTLQLFRAAGFKV
jgi:hypothetical protein